MLMHLLSHKITIDSSNQQEKESSSVKKAMILAVPSQQVQLALPSTSKNSKILVARIKRATGGTFLLKTLPFKLPGTYSETTKRCE